jgi:hypothetical protein
MQYIFMAQSRSLPADEVIQDLSIRFESDDLLAGTVGLGQWYALLGCPDDASITVGAGDVATAGTAELGPVYYLPHDIIRCEIAKYLVDEGGAYFISKAWSELIAQYLDAEIGPEACAQKFFRAALQLGLSTGDWSHLTYVLRRFPRVPPLSLGDDWVRETQEVVSCRGLHDVFRALWDNPSWIGSHSSTELELGQIRPQEGLIIEIALSSWQFARLSEATMKPPPALTLPVAEASVELPHAASSVKPSSPEDEIMRLISSLGGTKFSKEQPSKLNGLVFEIPADAYESGNLHETLKALLYDTSSHLHDDWLEALEETPDKSESSSTATSSSDAQNRVKWQELRAGCTLVSVESPTDAFAESDMREMLKSLMAGSYFDSDEEADDIWLPGARKDTQIQRNPTS